MLNELHKLAKTLENSNIVMYEWHDDYKELPEGDCYRIWLRDNGIVSKIDLMEKDLVANCRKYGNNQRTFPAFNIAALYRITSDKDKKYYDDLYKDPSKIDIERLRSMCVSENDNWNDKLLKKVDKCLHMKIPNSPEDSAVFSLMSITERMTGISFRTSLETCVWDYLKIDVKTYLPILFHKGNVKKEPEKDKGSLSIMLDLVDWELFGNPIASENTTKQINSWLQTEIDNNDTTGVRGLDAFGSPHSDVGKPMPSVRLARNFTIVLRTMFREHYCQYRYGKADDSSFPINKLNRSATKKALEWITQPENEGKTWRKIDSDAMLFVYPDKLPKIPLKFAELFGENISESRAGMTSEYRLEAIAEDFINSLNAIEPRNRPENIQIFALQQIPPATSKRAKVIFTRNLTVNGLIDAAREWQIGCRNLPNIHMINSIIPFPLEVSRIANKVWKQDGTRADGKSTANLMQYYGGMELLLDMPILSRLLRIVHGISINWIGFVLFVGNNIVRKDSPIRSAEKIETANFFSLLGLILYKCNVRKEDYMQDLAYLIGQILKLSDALHALYCEIKRDGKIPPQLAGNAVFVTASETPAKALALLSTRMVPYIAWAKQYRAQKTDTSQKKGLAGWYLRQYEILMTQLHSKLAGDVRLNDLEKAQLFIGYLAEFPKSVNEQSLEQEEIQDEQRN